MQGSWHFQWCCQDKCQWSITQSWDPWVSSACRILSSQSWPLATRIPRHWVHLDKAPEWGALALRMPALRSRLPFESLHLSKVAGRAYARARAATRHPCSDGEGSNHRPEPFSCREPQSHGRWGGNHCCYCRNSLLRELPPCCSKPGIALTQWLWGTSWLSVSLLNGRKLHRWDPNPGVFVLHCMQTTPWNLYTLLCPHPHTVTESTRIHCLKIGEKSISAQELGKGAKQMPEAHEVFLGPF